MLWEFVFFSTPDYLRVDVQGPFSLERQIRMFEEITTLDEWQPGLPILFDNRRLEMFAVDTQIIRQSVVIMQKFSRRHPATKIAGLVATNLNFGLGRQFETFTEIEGGTGFRLFRDEAQAVEWLQQPGDDDPA